MVSRTATWRFEYDGIFSILVEYNTPQNVVSRSIMFLKAYLPFPVFEGDLSSCFKLAASRRTGSSGSPGAPIAPGSFGRQSEMARHILMSLLCTDNVNYSVNTPNVRASTSTYRGMSHPRMSRY